ncbi:pilus assembly protein [Rubripirellula amarantea]|nr:pilus assembly protein [Rubripirellula amarantea]
MMKYSLAKRPSSRHHAPTGAVAVEFAISAAVLLLIIFASIEFTRMSMVRHAVKHASYLAARQAMVVGASTAEAEGVALNHLQNAGLSFGSVNVNPATITDDTQIVEVTVNVPVHGNSWIAPVYFSGDMTGRTRILAERAPARMAEAVPAGPAP